MKPVKLSPDEIGYLLGLLNEHHAYYRALAGNGNCTQTNRAKLEFIQTLVLKLSQPRELVQSATTQDAIDRSGPYANPID